MKRFWIDLWWLMLYAAAGVMVVVLSMLLLAPWVKGTPLLHLVQWIQNLFLMLLPAVLWVRWHKKERVPSTMRLRWPGWKLMGLVALLMVVGAPALDAMAEACERLPWPDVVMHYAREMHHDQELLLGMLLDVHGFWGGLELVALMCVATAVGEEAMFRGALLRCFLPAAGREAQTPAERPAGGRMLSVALWVGLIFSVCHGDVFGFVPRWVLGALLTLLVWRTGSLWTGVLAHAMNNLWALMGMKYAPQLADVLPSGAWVWMVSLAAGVAVAWLIVKASPRRP